MPDSAADDSNDRRPMPWCYTRLILVILVALVALSTAAAQADNDVLEEGGIKKDTAPGRSPGSYRQQALIALLTNERRSIDQRIERVMLELERIGSGDRASDMPSDLARLQQELIAFERRLGEVAVELAELKPGPIADDASGQPIFVPASKPRQPAASASVDDDRHTPELRRQLQEALVFLGGYDSRIDGDFGARTETAIRRYQASIGAQPTGRLTEEQVKSLLHAAKLRRDKSGLRSLSDDDIGFRLTYPGALLSKERSTDGGYRLLSDDQGRARLQVVAIDGRDLRTVFDDLTRHSGNGYRHFAGTWFIASGEFDGDMFYSMGRIAEGRPVVAHLTYPLDERERWDPFTVVLYNSFELMETR